MRPWKCCCIMSRSWYVGPVPVCKHVRVIRGVYTKQHQTKSHTRGNRMKIRSLVHMTEGTRSTTDDFTMLGVHNRQYAGHNVPEFLVTVVRVRWDPASNHLKLNFALALAVAGGTGTEMSQHWRSRRVTFRCR